MSQAHKIGLRLSSRISSNLREPLDTENFMEQRGKFKLSMGNVGWKLEGEEEVEVAYSAISSQPRSNLQHRPATNDLTLVTLHVPCRLASEHNLHARSA